VKTPIIRPIRRQYEIETRSWFFLGYFRGLILDFWWSCLICLLKEILGGNGSFACKLVVREPRIVVPIDSSKLLLYT
jgi:hypothetical protein